MNRMLLALVSVAHFLPHPFGVSPIGAMALYSGAYGPKHTGWLVALVPLFIGNLLFGFYNLVVLTCVYTGFALCAVVGRLMLTGSRTRTIYAAAIFMQALVFFLVSNFGNWLAFMPLTITGLLQTYANGLPYFGQALLVDAAYCYVLFGLHEMLARQRRPETAAT